MRLFLVKNGVPFDVAFSAHDEWAVAAYVTFVESEGMYEFDWPNGEWRKRD